MTTSLIPEEAQYLSVSGVEVLGAPRHPYTKPVLASLPVPNPAEQARRREDLRLFRVVD